MALFWAIWGCTSGKPAVLSHILLQGHNALKGLPMSADLTNDRQAKRNVAVLVAAQAILGGQMPMMFIVGGLAGGILTGNPCFATLPISLIVFGSMTTAPWLSPLMQKYGRKTGFFVGAIAGALGAAVSAYGL